MSFKTKGFTLIELLVVIAIIGILASIVLSSLNSARTSARDAAVKSNLTNLRPAAALAYSANGSFAGVCTGALSQGISAAHEASTTATGAIITDPDSQGAWNRTVCHDKDTMWAVEVPLSDSAPGSGGSSKFCVDSSGFADVVGTRMAGNSTDYGCAPGQQS